MLPTKMIPEASGHKSCIKAKASKLHCTLWRKGRDMPLSRWRQSRMRTVQGILQRGRCLSMRQGWVIQTSRRCIVSNFLTNMNLMSSKIGKGIKKNPIYLFFEVVSTNAEGSVGNPGDKHYQCYHDSHKVIMLTMDMNGWCSFCNMVDIYLICFFYRSY